MTSNTRPPDRDELPDEHELAALYARLPKTEPDDALDAAVMAAASAAVPAAAPVTVRRRPRWPVALGSAAVLVLAVGVGWQLRDTPIRNPALEDASRATTMPAPITTPAATPTATPVATPTAAAPEAARTEPAPVAEYEATLPAPPKMPPPRAAAKASVQRAPAIAPQVVRTEGIAEMRKALVGGSSRPNTPQLEGLIATKPSSLGPDDRVGEIRRLLDHGDRPAALRKLTELRRLYPHYDIPQDLRDLTP